MGLGGGGRQASRGPAGRCRILPCALAATCTLVFATLFYHIIYIAARSYDLWNFTRISDLRLLVAYTGFDPSDSKARGGWADQSRLLVGNSLQDGIRSAFRARHGEATVVLTAHPRRLWMWTEPQASLALMVPLPAPPCDETAGCLSFDLWSCLWWLCALCHRPPLAVASKPADGWLNLPMV